MKSPSGKFVLRLDPQLHGRLRQIAASKGVSLNALSAEILSNYRNLARSKASVAGDVGGLVLPAGLVARIVEVWGDELQAVVLFGSVARGDVWNDSDLDLFIVLGSNVAICRELYSKWDEFFGTFPRVSPQFVRMPTGQEEVGGIWYEVATEGIIIWDPVLTLSRVLQKLRDDIVTGAVSRHSTHGHSYWVKHRREAA